MRIIAALGAATAVALSGLVVGPATGAPSEHASVANQLSQAKKTPKVVAKMDAPCQTRYLNRQVKDRRGRTLICINEFGQRLWRLAPDATALKSHAGFLNYVDILASGSSVTTNVQVYREEGFPEESANAMLAAMKTAERIYGVDDNSAFVMAVTPEYLYNTTRALAEPCWDTVDAYAKGRWLQENAIEVRRQQFEGYGHAGLCSNVYFSYLNMAQPGVKENASALTATEGFMREYLIQSPKLKPFGNVGKEGDYCWEGESRAWNLTWAIMDRARTPGFTFPSRWAHWVSDLAKASGSYVPGLVASEKWISPENGDIRPEMPCQANPGIGHIQGALAREWLMATVGPEAYARYPEASRSVQDYRLGLQAATGITWDQWVANADARTSALVANYDESHRQQFPGLG